MAIPNLKLQIGPTVLPPIKTTTGSTIATAPSGQPGLLNNLGGGAFLAGQAPTQTPPPFDINAFNQQMVNAPPPFDINAFNQQMVNAPPPYTPPPYTPPPYTPPPYTPPTSGGQPTGGGVGGGQITAQSQAAASQGLIAEQQAKQAQITSLQSQVEVLQGKITTIHQAETGGLAPGGTFQQAVQFLTGEDGDDIKEVEGGESTLADLDAEVKAAYDALIGLQGESPETTEARKQVENILSSRDLGIEAARIKPIATPFIRGMEAGIQRQAEISTRPLLSQITDFQRSRELERDIAGLRLQSAEGSLTRGEAREKEKKAEEKERKAEAKEKETTENLTNSVMQNPFLFSYLTPTQQTNVIPGLSERGFDWTKIQEEVADTSTGTGGTREMYSAGDTQTINQAYLQNTSTETKNYFLSTEKAFQNWWTQALANLGGTIPGIAQIDIEDIEGSYRDWKEQNKKEQDASGEISGIENPFRR